MLTAVNLVGKKCFYIHTQLYILLFFIQPMKAEEHLVWFQKIYFTRFTQNFEHTKALWSPGWEDPLLGSNGFLRSSHTAHRATPWLYNVRQHLLIHNFELSMSSPGPPSPNLPYMHLPIYTCLHTRVYTHTTLHLFLPPLLPSKCVWLSAQQWFCASYVLHKPEEFLSFVSFWSFITDASKH